MKLSSDLNRIFLLQSIPSAATQLSSLAGLARKYVTEKFPKNYFKHIYVDTARSVSEMKSKDAYNHNTQKIPYPSLTESIEISLDDPFNVKNWNISDPYLGIRRPVDKNYVCIYRDQDNRMQLYATCEYVTSKFRFKLATDSYIANVELANYINARFRRDFFQYYQHQHIETEIPKTMMKVIAQINNLNLENDADVDRMSQIIAATSRTPRMIRKKVNNMTGKTSYFLSDEREILTYMADVDVPATIIRNDMSEGEYLIEFTVQMSAWQINNFILSVRKDIYALSEYQKLFPKDCIVFGDKMTLPEDETEPDSMVLPLTEIPVLSGKMCTFIDDFGNEQIGSMTTNVLYTRPADAIDGAQVTINIFNSFPDEFKQLMPYLKKKLSSKAMSQLIHVRLLTRYGELDKDAGEFEVDYFNLSVKVPNVDSEVRCVLYINRLFYELLLDCAKNGAEYTNVSKFGTWDINPFGTYKIRALIKAEPKLYKAENSLRVMTPAGVGYVVLGEPTNCKIAARVCIGKDKKGNPITKEMKEI